MREQFEAAYAALSAARNGRFHAEVLTRSADGEYVIPSVQSAWWAWQASREAVVVQLPFLYPFYKQEVTEALQALGLKVAP